MRAARRARQLGREAGFDLVRIARAEVIVPERRRYLEWVAAGRHADMAWIDERHALQTTDPEAALPGARSVICGAIGYRQSPEVHTSVGAGRVARYAWGRDYHAVLGERLEQFAGLLRREFGGEYRWFVDTGPLADKAFAVRAGLGWYGKNTNVLTPALGSWVLLGEIVTTVEIEPDRPLSMDCGRCRACVVACPTGALGPSYSIDSRKCISYLTIEHRGPVPVEYREAIGDWVFGCDICQDVCPPSIEPYLRTARDRSTWLSGVRATFGGSTIPPTGRPEPATAVAAPFIAGPPRNVLDLQQLLFLTHQQYLELFRETAIRRAKVWMLRRNAAIALGNVGAANVLPSLLCAVATDEHALVRGHAAWAVGRLACRGVASLPRERLVELRRSEPDESVRGEIDAALAPSLVGAVPVQPPVSRPRIMDR